MSPDERETAARKALEEWAHALHAAHIARTNPNFLPLVAEIWDRARNEAAQKVIKCLENS